MNALNAVEIERKIPLALLYVIITQIVAGIVAATVLSVTVHSLSSEVSSLTLEMAEVKRHVNKELDDVKRRVNLTERSREADSVKQDLLQDQLNRIEAKLDRFIERAYNERKPVL